jgi:hypothetical protein
MVVDSGPQTISTVSAEYDWWYRHGYEAGVYDRARQVYEGDSEPAWMDFMDGNL